MKGIIIWLRGRKGGMQQEEAQFEETSVLGNSTCTRPVHNSDDRKKNISFMFFPLVMTSAGLYPLNKTGKVYNIRRNDDLSLLSSGTGSRGEKGANADR